MSLDVSEPVQIPDVPEPVQIPVTSPTATYADSPRTLNILDVPEPVQIPVSHNLCPQNLEPHVQIPVSQRPTATCAFHLCFPRTYADSTCRTCTDSSVTRPTATYADSTCIRTCAASSVTRPTATYADSTCTCADSSVTRPTVTCAESPRTYAASPRARHVGPFGVDRCIRPAHVVCIWTPRTPAASHGTLYF
ncbi:hypothetical protein TNCV_4882761 [Trichonephila clavipes]|nr:hypothetical protein TNCV_4882761 [Trichonephila clavipes]